MSITIELPWPDRKLSPNARVHWRVKAGAVKIARALAKYAIIESGATRAEYAPIKVRWTFHPPDHRPRDDDNIIGSVKAYRDGLADGLGINDRLFKSSYEMASAVKGGVVVVRIGGR